jgi:outer membrane protein TolC
MRSPRAFSVATAAALLAAVGALRPTALPAQGAPASAALRLPASGAAGAAVRAAAAPDAGSAAAVAFWEQLGDSTLDRLVGEALAANREVRAAEARVRRARAERRLSALDLAPRVTASTGYTRRLLSGAQFPGLAIAPQAQDLYDAGFDASWELDVFGRVRRAVAARAALERSAREELRDVQLTLVSELVRSYFELRGVQDRLAVAERNAGNQRRTVQLTADRLSAGRGTGFDRERAGAQLSATLATVPTLESRPGARPCGWARSSGGRRPAWWRSSPRARSSPPSRTRPTRRSPSRW